MHLCLLARPANHLPLPSPHPPRQIIGKFKTIKLALTEILRILMEWSQNKFEDVIENGGETRGVIGGKDVENTMVGGLEEVVLAAGAAVGVRVGERGVVIEQDGEAVGGVAEVTGTRHLLLLRRCHRHRDFPFPIAPSVPFPEVRHLVAAGGRKAEGMVFATNWTKGGNNSGQRDVCIENHGNRFADMERDAGEEREGSYKNGEKTASRTGTGAPCGRVKSDE